MATINTTTQVYGKLVTAVASIRTLLGPRIKVFVKLPRAKQKEWLSRDPLLKDVLRLVRDINKANVEASEVD